MALFWSSSETVSNGQLKSLIDEIPTYTEVGAIVKANSGGSAKITKLLGYATSSKQLTTIGAGYTKKIMLCCSDTGYAGMCMASSSDSTTVSINGGSNMTISGTTLNYIPKDTPISIYNNGSATLYIKGIGYLYEVE